MNGLSKKLHKGSVKLASLYLAIIMAISLFFSATIYQLSVQELDRGLRGPRAGLERAIGLGYSQELREEIYTEREQLYNEAKERVLERLIITNIVILIGGGFLSYYLALRTLRPIEEAQESQSRFTADASHELRTPITAMLAENEVTLMNTKLTLSEAKEQITSNIEELHKLTALSDGLMRLAGLENSTLLKETVVCNEIIIASVNRVQNLANEKSISITTNSPKSDVVVKGDEQSLIETLVILLDNAIKYSPKNTKISIKLYSYKDSAIIEINDEGLGIKASDIPHLFDRFYRADVSRTKQEIHGYGLGLAIAKDIISKHGGDITVKSKPEHGSTFTISLPIK